MKLHQPLDLKYDEHVEGHLLFRIIGQDQGASSYINVQEACSLTVNDQIQIIKALSRAFTFMPQFEVQILVDQRISTSFFYKLDEDMPKRVTFFGGSFNPFHLGHLACIDLTPEEPIIVIPDLNPFKELMKKRGPLKDFLTICLNLKSVTKASVYPGFLALNQANPTIDWMKNVSIAEKNLIVGDDSFLSFHRWKSYEELLGLCHTLYVVPRNHSLAEYEEQKMKFLKLGVNTKFVRLPEHLYMAHSSTNLRQP